MDTAIIVAIVAAVASPVATYVVVRRQRSGKVATSEASELWKESGTIRAELYSEVNRLRTEIAAVRKEHLECQAKLITQARQIDELRDLVSGLGGGGPT